MNDKLITAEMLTKFKDGSWGVVDKNEIKVGDQFVSANVGGKAIVTSISEIHEQRKERGVYVDESKRRMWAKVS